MKDIIVKFIRSKTASAVISINGKEYEVNSSFSILSKIYNEMYNTNLSFSDIVEKYNNQTKISSICCFCHKDFLGYGNSTWPIYFKEDGEKNRCCNECNNTYVIPSRNDKSLIMSFRKKFGIDYSIYKNEI